jgi:sigma-E factor negative regulatory protein RseB
MAQLSHWRIASAAAVFVLAGSSAVALAMHDEPSGAYQSLPMSPVGRRSPAAGNTAAERTALVLLTQAVAACRSTAFSGIQVFRWWGPSGPQVWLTQIWHRPGGQLVADPISAGRVAGADGNGADGNGADGDGADGDGADGDGGDRDGADGGDRDGADGGVGAPGPTVSMTISGRQLALLRSGYVLRYAGHGSADGRAAEVVTVERPNGSLAGRFWLDGRTKLPLRRQLFDDRERLVSDISLSELRTGLTALSSVPGVGTQPWGQQLTMSDIGALRAQGWPLPAELPGGMVLFAASQSATPAGTVIGASYSDGLSVISLFVQRGQLSAQLPGWQRIAIAGHNAYSIDPDDQTIAWSGDGYVFTLLADAPAASVDQAIAALPQGSEPGFWGRLGRGFRRLASLANPFR